ncbi:right-handed parallel beta-helix repeat-containing protein [Planktothrix mougeotii]|uniref:Right-handed parallel beta-helix repeat-containing protein n=1 Tax=Planktothrix mougeotii LEGE 06226 TaxID=1828728 RepID=A0ABR9UGE4_9CYAN|nr:right-handed parallel beta-helix repeat-containing protein [Planktothrix mougeotii]MBE9144614.1 right-handed parallel beta-helix repeat-containing protein [Planktothrix mougeotii LEGE 06226]
MNSTRRQFLQQFLTTTATTLILPPIFDQISQGETSNSLEKIYSVSPTGNDNNSGTLDQPWATIQKAANTLKAGDKVYIRGGKYNINQPIRPQFSGLPNQWIIYAGYPGEQVIIDADEIFVEPPTGSPPYPHDQGAFLIIDKSYILIQNLTVINSHNAGFTVRNSHHINFYNNTTINTYSSGIAIWNNCYEHQVIGNTVINANRLNLRIQHPNVPPRRQAPHEAITLAGVKDFEVAYNLVCYSEKEGIDCKETCVNGRVHHNYTHHLKRQGLYADSWFGVLENIEFDHNIVEECETGIAISAEDGPRIENIKIHHNLVYNNRASGIFISRWGKDRLKKNIQIYNNTIVLNGYGKIDKPQPYWLTGGIYLYSTQVEDLVIENNILSENKYFQIGFSRDFQENDFTLKNIKIDNNLIFQSQSVTYPVYLEEWAKDYVYSTKGNNFIEANPNFQDSPSANFYLQPNSPAITDGNPPYLGAFPPEPEKTFWWLVDFPPQFQI